MLSTVRLPKICTFITILAQNSKNVQAQLNMTVIEKHSNSHSIAQLDCHG